MKSRTKTIGALALVLVLLVSAGGAAGVAPTDDSEEFSLQQEDDEDEEDDEPGPPDDVPAENVTADEITIEETTIEDLTAEADEVVIRNSTVESMSVDAEDVSFEETDVEDLNVTVEEINVNEDDVTVTIFADSVDDVVLEDAEGVVIQLPQVSEPAGDSYEVDDLDAPEEATVGDEIEVTAEVTNPNEFTTTQHAEFRLDGDVIDREYLTLDGDETETVSFDVDTTEQEAGESIHGVFTFDNGELAELTLEEDVEEPEEEEEAEEEEPTASVTFEEQESDGTTVTVDEVNVSDGGFVAIHDETLIEEDDPIGSTIGVTEHLEPGEHEDVEATLFEEDEVPGAEFDQDELEEDQTLIAMPHLDTNDNETYEFVETEGAEDGPYVDDEGEAVTDEAEITLEEEVAEPEADDDDEYTNDTDETEDNETDT